MKVKMSDIAKEVGVSVTAVSFALNDKSGISPEKKEEVLETAKRMGYEFKETEKSRQRKHNRGKTILLLNCSRTSVTRNVFPSTPYFKELLKAFDLKLSAMGYCFWVETLLVDDNFEDSLKQTLYNSNINGILLVATDMQEEDIELVLRNEPNTVVLDACFDSLEANCVVMDNYLGGVLAARKALKGNHRNIGYVQSDVRIYNFKQRRRGFMETLEQAGVYVKPENILFAESSIGASADQLCTQLSHLKEMPTFFFTENDYLALGLMTALNKMNIKIPEQVSVVGFDNIELSSLTKPQLSTINVPKEKLAEFCVRQLTHILRTKNSVKIKHLIAVNLLERQTTRDLQKN